MGARRPPSGRQRLLAAIFALGLLATACGGDGNEEADGATEDPVEQETTEETIEPTSEPEATEEAASFDQTIEFVVPYDPGGGYDQYVRAIGPYLGECLGTTVIAINEPGAGSLLATNQTASAAPDGTRIQIFNTIGAIAAQVGGADGVNFDLGELTWLARITNEPSVLSVGANSEFETFEDMIAADRTIRFGATGPGSNEYIFASALGQVFDLDIEIVTGFAGSGEVQASLIQGEIDANVLSIGSSLAPIQDGDARPLVLVGSDRHEALPDTPTVYDFEAVSGEEELLDGIVALVETARAVAGPPGMDDAVTEVLRAGLECALNDAEFLADAEAQERDVSYLSGEETQELVTSVLDPPPALRALLEEAF